MMILTAPNDPKLASPIGKARFQCVFSFSPLFFALFRSEKRIVNKYSL